jgi:predicted dehydrogenase
MNRTGYKAKAIAERYQAAYATTDYQAVLNDKEVDLVFITTRHDSHAQLALQALKKGKHVFVEKPLATNEKDLTAIEDFYKSNQDGPLLMVGYNRRFSPYAREIKKHTSQRQSPLFIHYRMNAGFLPADHWIFEQGGRIIGEGCHIIDLMNFFTDSEIESVTVNNLRLAASKYSNSDNVSFSLAYKDGSIATVEYFAVGSKKLSKEFLEVHFDEKSIIMDDYKNLTGYGINIKNLKSRLAEKGLSEELTALYDALSTPKANWPIAFWDLIQTTKVTLKINENN